MLAALTLKGDKKTKLVTLWWTSFASVLCAILLAGCQFREFPLFSDNGDANSETLAAIRTPSKDKLVLQEEGAWVGNRAIAIGVKPQSTHASDPSNVADEQMSWRLSRGESVTAVVRRWAVEAGYVALPKFTAHENWRVIVDQHYSGTFEEALTWLSDGFSRQSVKPVAILYANRTLDIIAVPAAVTIAGEPAKSPPFFGASP
jgi:hypothetical protein